MLLKICPVYISKHNSKCKNHVIVLMVPNREGWSRKIINIITKNNIKKNKNDFYCLNCLHFFRRANKSEYHDSYIKIKVSWDHECLIEKVDRCKNNVEPSFTKKVGEHILSGFLMSAILSFKSIEVKHVVCRGKDFIKKLCESLRGKAVEISNFKKKKWGY